VPNEIDYNNRGAIISIAADHFAALHFKYRNVRLI
jgi:hypothetical protein